MFVPSANACQLNLWPNHQCDLKMTGYKAAVTKLAYRRARLLGNKLAVEPDSLTSSYPRTRCRMAYGDSRHTLYQSQVVRMSNTNTKARV